MKLFSMLVAIVFFTGCTSFKPVGLAQSDLRDQIASKKAIQAGEKVKIVTGDGMHYEFKVVDVTDDYIEGKSMKVPIADIVAIETKEFSGVKTVLLAVGLVALVQLAVAIGSTPGLMNPHIGQ